MAAVLLFALAVGTWLLGIRAGAVLPGLGMDLDTYRNAAASWLSGGPFYQPYQLAGSYDVARQPILYPPMAIPLFALFTVLPRVLWWVVPAVVFVAVVPRTPARLALALSLVAWPQSIMLIWAGNPVMWVASFLALARFRPWFAPLVLIKPTLAPFALYRSNRRTWWYALLFLGVVSLAFGSMWLDYVTVLGNAENWQGAAYIFGNVPLLLLCLLRDMPEPDHEGTVGRFPTLRRSSVRS
jgi:hypothetical protein